MKCFSWTTSGLSAGLELKADQKFGQVLFLGEEGRGRRYEKIALGRRNPAEVVNGRVMNANPVKITLPAKDGKPEKTFYVLEQPTTGTQNVLVRINSYGGYIKYGQGGYSTAAGKPETLISGYGAFGDAGRIGNWTDGLVVMHPGDVIRIHPSRTWGHGDSALWMDKTGQPQTASWQDYETMMAIHAAEATVADAEEKPQGLPLLAGQMPIFSFQGGEIILGFKLEKGAAGASVRLGEEGRGRKLAEIPIVGEPPMVPCPSRNDSYGWYYLDREPGERDVKKCSGCGLRYEIVRGERIEIAHPRDKGEVLGVLPQSAVADLGKGIFGLVQSEKSEPNAYLVRVCTGHGYTRRGGGLWELWKGNPTVVTKGYGADGDAGGIGSWDDGLMILREGDVVRVRPSGDGPAYALFVEGGKVQSEPWVSWKVKDAKRDPNFYVAKGTSPWGYVPAEWVGRVVTTMTMGERGMSGGHSIPSYAERETGELISIEPFVLNLGWDGQDYHAITVRDALWIVLTDKQVRRLEGEGLAKRQALRKEAELLRDQAKEAQTRSHFQLLDRSLREEVAKVAAGETFDTMPTEGWHGSLTGWVESAKRTLGQLAEADSEAKSLEARQNSGEVLKEFTAWHRRGGMSNNGDGWVIQADGSRREADSNDVRRHKSDGNYTWQLVKPEELALRWSCGHMGDVAGNSNFEVAKLPVSGATAEQLEAVKVIEEEIEAPEGAFGLNPEIVRRNSERVHAIRTAAGKVLRQVPEFDYYKVVGHNGVGLQEGTNSFGVNHAQPFDERCDGRDAQVVRKVPAGDGMLEFLAYDKYGQMNFSMRWRPLRQDEASKPQPEPIAEGGNFTDVGNRWFKCPAGHTTRMDRADWGRYQQGEALTLACSLCATSGSVKK